MAKGYKFLGGSDVLNHEGKSYHAGDTVPLTEEEARRLLEAGLYFEGFDLPATSGSAAFEAHPELQPKGRG